MPQSNGLFPDKDSLLLHEIILKDTILATNYLSYPHSWSVLVTWLGEKVTRGIISRFLEVEELE